MIHHLSVLLTAYFFIVYLGLSHSPTPQKKPLDYVPPVILKHFSFGYQEVIADMGWLRAIQSLDICEQNKAIVGEAKSGKNRQANCEEGWVYHMLDFISELAPRFRIPQAVGPIMLSVSVDDRRGATLLFEKAIKNFPEDWSILFRAAYHYLYEEENYSRAAELFDLAGKNGAPLWVHSLSAKLYSRAGKDIVAKIVLEDYLKRAKLTEQGEKQVKKRLAEINARLAKER